jgi:hypothetical protein
MSPGVNRTGWRAILAMLLIAQESENDVRLSRHAHSGLALDIAPCPKSAKKEVSELARHARFPLRSRHRQPAQPDIGRQNLTVAPNQIVVLQLG